MALDNSINIVENNETLNNDELMVKNDILVDENSSLNNEIIINNDDENNQPILNENDTEIVDENTIKNGESNVEIESITLDNQESKMNDELNKIVIVNLSNDDDDDNTSIPTPTITTAKAIDTDLDSDNEKNFTKKEDNVLSPTNSIDINVTTSVNEISTETNNVTENTTEKVVSSESVNEKEIQETIQNDSSLSDIDIDQMISEQLNTDFTEVDLNSTKKDVSSSISNNNMESITSDLMNESGQMSFQQIIDEVDNDKNSVVSIGNTTADIINSSLMKLNEDNGDTVDESIVEQINTSLDSSADSETSTESDEAVNIKIILNSSDNKESESFNTEDIKIIVTDPDNVRQVIYPYQENGFKDAINKAIERHKSKSKSSIKSKSKSKSKSKKHKKVKKTVRFNIENDTYNSDNEVIPMVDENSIESLKKEIDRLNSRIVEEIKARTILQHTLDDTIVETEKIKKEAIEKSDLKIRETMEYTHRLQESMDKRINKMQNENLEKYKELQAAHDQQLEEERDVWRQIEQDARKRLQNERDEKNRVIEENKRLEKVIEKLKAQIEEEISNSERFQISVKQMLEEYEIKYKEEQESRKNAEEVIDRVLEKSRDFQENVEDLNLLNETLKNSNRELSEQINNANSKIEYKDKLIEELKSKIGDLDFTIEILKEESENNIKKIKILSSETQNITDRSIQQINEVKEENVSIYKLLDATTKKYDELQILYNVKEEEVELLKKKMEQMNKKFKRILRKNLIRGELNSATSPIVNFANSSFEIANNSNDAIGKVIKETPILGEPNSNSVMDDVDDNSSNSSIHKHVIRKKASNGSISSTTLSISSLLMTSNDINMTPILPYGMSETIKEEEEEDFEDEVIPEVPESEKPSETSSPVSIDSSNNKKKLELPKLTIQTSSDEIIESILSAQDVSDDDTDDDTDTEYKPMNDGELSTIIEKRTMDFRTDDAEYLDFVEKLKVPSKISNAKFVKRCETEEVTGCLAFEGEYAGFFNNRKLWNNAKAGTILIEPINKKTTSSESSDDTAVAETHNDAHYVCALCSLHQDNDNEMMNWFKFKACDTDPNYENICPYCREKLANVCEWYSYIRLIQNKVIKKSPKLIYSDLLDIKRKLFYSKNGITFKYQN